MVFGCAQGASFWRDLCCFVWKGWRGLGFRVCVCVCVRVSLNPKPHPSSFCAGILVDAPGLGKESPVPTRWRME